MDSSGESGSSGAHGKGVVKRSSSKQSIGTDETGSPSSSACGEPSAQAACVRDCVREYEGRSGVTGSERERRAEGEREERRAIGGGTPS
eukprot:6209596-Pleurochrysis_carterae.AAC.1